MSQQQPNKVKVEEELLLSQLEKNFLLLEQDFKTMFVKVQKGLHKLCDLTKRGIDEYCSLLENSENAFNKIIRNCERLQESSMSLEILSIKIQHFREVTEEKMKAREKLLKEKRANNEKLSAVKKIEPTSLNVTEPQQKIEETKPPGDLNKKLIE